MNLFHCNQNGYLKQALFRVKRPVYVLDEAKPAAEAQKPKEQAEKPKPSGVPIDQPVKTPEQIEQDRQATMNAAKERMTEAEKKIIDKYGGAIFGMNKTPQGAEKDYKNEVYVNVPPNPEKFVDKDGKPVPPRVVYYFHGNGGKVGADADNIMRQVEEMRAKGDNVILVMPQDNKGHWKDLDHPQAFKDMQKMVESLTGGKPIKDISISSFSGGYAGVEKVLKNLRENSSTDPESKRLYTQIRQLGFLDSAYGGSKEFAQWAANKNHTLYSNCTGPCESGNRLLQEAVSDARGGDMSGIRFESFNGVHGNAPLKFSEAMRREGGVRIGPEEAGATEAPTRSPEVLSKADFLKGLEACKTHEERQRFLLSNPLSPDCLQERTYETEVNGRKVQVKMTGLLAYGAPGDSVTAGMDAMTSQAIADMLGGELPTAKFQQRLYDDNSVQKVPFFTGEQLEARVNEDRKARGLTPLNINVVTSTGEKQRNGAAMESADYMKAESERLEKWLKDHNIPKGTLMVGGRKIVLAPEDDGKKLLTFGGGLYTEPVKDDAGNVIDVRASGRLVQGIGDRAHNGIYYDYSQGTEVMTGILVDGKDVPFEKIKNDPQYADIREELFGKSLGSRYQYPAWMREFVDEYRQNPQSRPAAVTASAKPESAPVAQTSSSPVAQNPSALAAKAAPAAKAPASNASATETASSAPSNAAPGTPKPATDTTPAQTPPAAVSTETAAPQPSLPLSGGNKSKAGDEKPSEGTDKPAEGTEKPAEGAENPPTIPYTSLGDSFTVGYDTFSRGSFVKLDYHKRKSREQPDNPEMVGKTTGYMKERLIAEVLPNAERNGIKTIVIGGGANDILGPLKTDEAKSKVEESVKANLGAIYQNCRKAGLNVVALTMAPFDRFIESRFNDPAEKARHYALWEAINAFIIGLENSPDGPNVVIRAHELVGDQKPDGSWIRRQEMNARDGLHMQTAGLKLISGEIQKNLNSLEKAPASSGATGA